jgi:hypothetical protein
MENGYRLLAGIDDDGDFTSPKQRRSRLPGSVFAEGLKIL